MMSNPSLIGQIHNDVMDLVYDKLNSITEAPTEEELQSMIKEEMKTYFNDYFSEDLNENHISNFMNSFSVIPDLPDLSEEYEVMIEYAEDIENSVNPNLDVLSYNSLIDNIINNADNDNRLTADSRLLIKMIGSISKSSNQYWKENSLKWEVLGENFNLAEASNLQPGYKGRVIKADGWGAARGAVSGGIAGLGVASIPFAVVGGLVGGAMASSFTGIREYFGYTTWWPF